ncbi:MAG: UbiD family decarboxylase [Acidobacteriota bacterium]
MSELRRFIDELRSRRLLVDIEAEVDPKHEMTEIACRLVKTGGPAVLFHRPRGSDMPVLLNVLGTEERLALALGRQPEAVASELHHFLEDAVPPRPSLAWTHRRLLRRALYMKPKVVRSPACRQVVEEPRLSQLPVLTLWPGDGGPFLTWPLIVTRHPEHGDDNLGLYRMQVFNDRETGMHWQIGKGGGFHHHAAERLGQDLPCAVALGADPLTMFAAMMPLPEGISELAFAGFLRGGRTRITRSKAGLPVPADAEIVLEGSVPWKVRRLEGPFGDHFGHYSHAADFPVFRVDRVWRRKDAIYVAAVVGRPPQEDRFLGEAVQEMFLPLLKLPRPEIRDAWAFYEAGFHALFAVSMRTRYEKESLKTAFSLLGEGQVSLTKILMVAPHDVDCRDPFALFRALGRRFDPRRDLHVFGGTSADTLDFTGPKLNRGSKMVLDLTGPERPERPPLRLPDLATETKGVLEQRLVEDAVLLLRLAGDVEPRAQLRELLERRDLGDVPLIVGLSDDLDLDDRESWLWGWFTRFDPASDLIVASARLDGPIARVEGPLAIDATWKQGYPEPLVMPEEIVDRVDRRWSEYGLG